MDRALSVSGLLIPAPLRFRSTLQRHFSPVQFPISHAKHQRKEKQWLSTSKPIIRKNSNFPRIVTAIGSIRNRNPMEYTCNHLMVIGSTSLVKKFSRSYWEKLL